MTSLNTSIIPCLHLNHPIEAAVQFYLSLFPKSRRIHSEYWQFKTPSTVDSGAPMAIAFEILGIPLIATGKMGDLTPESPLSLSVCCQTLSERQSLVETLSQNGGMITTVNPEFTSVIDPFGIPWQLHVTTVPLSNKHPYLSIAICIDEDPKTSSDTQAFYSDLFKDSSITPSIQISPSKPSISIDDTPLISLILICENINELLKTQSYLSSSKPSEFYGWVTDSCGVTWQPILAIFRDLMNLSVSHINSKQSHSKQSHSKQSAPKLASDPKFQSKTTQTNSHTFAVCNTLWLYPGEKASWHFLSIPSETAEKIQAIYGNSKHGWGSLRVLVTINATQWETSIFPDKKSNTYLLPVKASVRKKEQLCLNDEVNFSIEIRENPV